MHKVYSYEKRYSGCSNHFSLFSAICWKTTLDCNDTEIWKIVASSADFLFGEDLEAILSLTESDSFDESLESASMVTERSSELQIEEPEAP